MRKRALLLCNMGTPDSASPKSVRRYLAEFLMDPFVVDIPWVIRAALVYGIILPRRAHASAEAYSRIWTPAGSPLAVHQQELGRKVAEVLAPEGWLVRPVMRYGSPSIEAAVDSLHGENIDEIIFLPLYPQYSEATIESSVREFSRVVRKRMPHVQVRIVPPFYHSSKFISAFTEVAGSALTAMKGYDHVLFSFHGLPERQVRKADRTGSCMQGEKASKPASTTELASARFGCCGEDSAARRGCYRAQCEATARLLAHSLGLASGNFTISFQSRLGRTPWIGPYTDAVLAELAKKGVKKLAVICPAFVADCLETLEEIGIRNRELFRSEGGEELVLVPSLNSHPAWVRAVVELAAAPFK